MVKPLNKVSRRVLKYFFESREPVLLAQAGDIRSPPVFLVGPPRSGTTLIYQAITSGLRTAYFCNFAEWYPHTPLAASEFLNRAIERYESDFTSDYGEVAGRAAPSEAKGIWKSWLGRDRTDGSDMRMEKVAVARRTIAALQKMRGAPFVAKDISNALRIRALDKLFPGCLFVRVSLNPADIAQSILVARQTYRQEHDCAHTNNPLQEWVFIDSCDYEQFYDLPYLEQIANQVFHTDNILEEDLAEIPEARVLRMDYEQFCLHPREELDRLTGFTAAHGTHFQAKAPIPAAFRTRLRGEHLEGVNELRDLVHRLYANWQFAGAQEDQDRLSA